MCTRQLFCQFTLNVKKDEIPNILFICCMKVFFKIIKAAFISQLKIYIKPSLKMRAMSSKVLNQISERNFLSVAIYNSIKRDNSDIFQKRVNIHFLANHFWRRKIIVHNDSYDQIFYFSLFFKILISKTFDFGIFCAAIY